MEPDFCELGPSEPLVLLPAGEALAVAGAGSLLVCDALPLLVSLAVGKGKVSLFCLFLWWGMGRHVRQGLLCCAWMHSYGGLTFALDPV